MKTVIEMAKEAGFTVTDYYPERLKRFAALVRAEREWVDLTDDEIYEVCKAVPFVIIGPDYDKAVSNAVIAAFKEKNK